MDSSRDLSDRLLGYFGGFVAFSGLALATSFLDVRASVEEPVAAMVIDNITLPIMVIGILSGIALILVGLWIYGLSGSGKQLNS